MLAKLLAESTLSQISPVQMRTTMGFENLQAGSNPPDDMNVVIEIAANSSAVKYELDKSSGLLTVDRFLTTAMCYPCNYGFIPHTLSEDGDPVDVLVLSPFSLMPGILIRARPVGLLQMTDEAGNDVKILAVPIAKITPCYGHVKEPKDLDKELLDKIEHFFKHYKDLEPGKWTKINGWQNAESAREVILEGIKRYTA